MVSDSEFSPYTDEEIEEVAAVKVKNKKIHVPDFGFDSQTKQKSNGSWLESIRELRSQNSRLKKQNQKLVFSNLKLAQQLSLAKNELAEFSIKMLQESEQIRQTRRKKIEQMMKQTYKIKQQMQDLRAESEIQKFTISNLKTQIEILNCEKSSWVWKQNFIELFVSMLQQISSDIDVEWNTKKKVQVGWKIIKNIISKALDTGIKPPKVERSFIN